MSNHFWKSNFLLASKTDAQVHWLFVKSMKVMCRSLHNFPIKHFFPRNFVLCQKQSSRVCPKMALCLILPLLVWHVISLSKFCNRYIPNMHTSALNSKNKKLSPLFGWPFWIEIFRLKLIHFLENNWIGIFRLELVNQTNH